MAITEERKKRVIDLYYNRGKTTREIAKIERMSIRDISAILKEEEARRQKDKHQQQQEEISSKAYELFSEGKRPVEVAIALNLREPDITKMHREYWKLRGLDKLNTVYKDTNGELGPFLKLYRQLIKEKHMSIHQVADAVDTDINRLPYMENLYEQVKDQAEKMQHTIQQLANDIKSLELKISLLDRIVFSSEQDCRKKELQVQELTTQKDRLEKLIANILNAEGYSKLKAIVKENVKAVLSDNKTLLSTAFAAIIQTLKDNPEMANLIYSIPTANNGEQYEDNNDNNINKYFEFNKDDILNLAKKNYENLVEAFTKDAIDTASSPPNSASSLPQSSLSTFSSPSNQSDMCRIEKTEIYHNNSEDDIAD